MRGSTSVEVQLALVAYPQHEDDIIGGIVSVV
jgi:hypothetical protein